MLLNTKSSNIIKTNGGHMAYQHLIISDNNKNTFLKTVDVEKLRDKSDIISLQKYIIKEKMYYDYLKLQSYTHLPNNIILNNHTLTMDALLSSDEWHWRIPNNPNQANRYITETLHSLNELTGITTPEQIDIQTNITPTNESLWDEGWSKIDDNKINLIKHKIKTIINQIRPESIETLNSLIDNLHILREIATNINRSQNLTLSHGDARQSNIAWHPDYGVKIVDWAWAGLAPKNADSTMFLIDLTKSEIAVDDYLSDYFNQDHAIILIGFWLNHCTLNTQNESKTIRLQQIISAISAFRLINHTS